MSKKIYLFSLVLLTLAFVSCSETEGEGRYDNWRSRSESFIDSIANAYANSATRGNLDSIHMIQYRGVPIYYKKKTPVGDAGVQDVIPFYTSTISCYYKGQYSIGYVDDGDNYIGEVFDGTFTGAEPSIDFSRTALFEVSSLVVGLAEVLQRMNVGERREVYIPWEYGYGSSDYKPPYSSITIRGYSTLVFDIQLLGIEEE